MASSQETGHKLELSDATTAMADAITSGDPEALRKAAGDHATALNSQATAMAAAIAKPLYAQGDEMLAQVKALAEIVTNARQADLNWRTEERTTRDAQSTRLYEELDKLIAAAEESGRGLKKHDEELARLAAVQSDHGERLDELKNIEDWRTGVDTRLSAIEQADRDDIRAEIKSTNAEIVIMKEMLARYDTDLKELVDRLAARGGDEERNGARKEVAPGG